MGALKVVAGMLEPGVAYPVLWVMRVLRKVTGQGWSELLQALERDASAMAIVIDESSRPAVGALPRCNERTVSTGWCV